MLSILAGRRIQKLLVKNQIQVLHHIPGRIRLKSPFWVNSPIVASVVEELEREPHIISVSYTPAVGTVLVLFEESLSRNYGKLEEWIKKLDLINLS